MFYVQSFISLIEAVMVLIPGLLSVAYITVAERKTMASMQRRLGPNTVGYYGLLQAFADALKLLLKEYVFPTQANAVLFFLGPVVTLMFSLLGFYVIPYSPGITISDFNLGILYMLAMSSLSTYGILLAGWSANSKYAFLGSLRSTAQLISYELILGSAILLVILFSGSLSLTTNIESQKAIWYAIPICPVFAIFFIGSVAETNRAPFDLVEAESELVSGFMTEHAGVIFVFFFLAEYASILLICILTTILFLGGYLFDTVPIYIILQYVCYPLSYLIQGLEDLYVILLQGVIFIKYLYYYTILNEYFALGYIMDRSLVGISWFEHVVITNFDEIQSGLTVEPYKDNPEIFTYDLFNKSFSSNPLVEGIINAAVLSIKSCIMIFIFIWTRASYPRIRYDQLMSYCWTVLLPIIIALIVIIPCMLYNLSIIPSNICLFYILFTLTRPSITIKAHMRWLRYNLNCNLISPPMSHASVTYLTKSKVDFHLDLAFCSAMDTMTIALNRFEKKKAEALKLETVRQRIYAIKEAIVEQEDENVQYFSVLVKKALEIRDSKVDLVSRQDGAHDIHLYVNWWFKHCGSVGPNRAGEDCIEMSNNIIIKGSDPTYGKDNHEHLLNTLDKAKKWRLHNSDELKGILDEIIYAVK